MVAIKAKTSVKMRVDAACPSHSRSDIKVRDVSFVIDEPVERGGGNMGPSPTETLMGALVGCTNVIANKVAKKMGIEIANLAVSVVADFDRRGVTLQDEVDVPFQALKLKVELDTAAGETEIETLRQDVAKFCPLSKLFRQAGTKIDEEWVIRRTA